MDNNTKKIYVKDINTGELISVAGVPQDDTTPIQQENANQHLIFSPDSNEIIFVSSDSNLVNGDNNNADDIFKVRIGQETTGFVLDKAEHDTVSTSGSVQFTDPDAGDTHIVTVQPGEGAVGTLAATISKEPDSDGPGSIAWIYTVDHKSVPALAEGQSRVETFTVSLDDGHGGTSDQVITITTRGAAPSAASSASEHGASVAPSVVARPATTVQSSPTNSSSLVQPTAYTAYVVTMYQDHV
ncbi:VCBS domain-containing protein [Methylobacterium fujisawaense]|uniref:VCBS domain-containing protein n=1 Tax=Methylobacterium fujisawaense TaxID=107400 RepID=UPI0037021FBC